VSTEQQLASLESDMFSLEEVRFYEDYAYKILFIKKDGAWSKVTGVICDTLEELADDFDSAFRKLCRLPPKKVKRPLAKCKDEYKNIRRVSVAKKILDVVDPLGIFGDDGPLTVISNEFGRSSDEGFFVRIFDSTKKIFCSIGDSAINVALLGIPSMVDAGSEAAVAVAETPDRLCLACHLAYVVYLWLQTYPKTPPEIDDLEGLESNRIPPEIGEKCGSNKLSKRIKNSKSNGLIVDALEMIQEASSPLSALLAESSYDADKSPFLAAVRAIGPVMVRKLASPDIWKRFTKKL
jgi:hypothetical protein